MGGLIESQIRRAIEALGTGERAALDDVIQTDHKVNAKSLSKPPPPCPERGIMRSALSIRLPPIPCQDAAAA